VREYAINREEDIYGRRIAGEVKITLGAVRRTTSSQDPHFATHETINDQSVAFAFDPKSRWSIAFSQERSCGAFGMIRFCLVILSCIESVLELRSHLLQGEGVRHRVAALFAEDYNKTW
jgi:hypothetical protein